ncbi:MAG: ribonuclease HIII [Planctomycetes bacterium]|nr:ribonuclease HIII [Planctomycetota bacterium]
MEGFYRRLREEWTRAGLRVGEAQAIAHGLQFEVSAEGSRGIARIYSSRKRGVHLDLSQVRDPGLRSRLGPPSSAPPSPPPRKTPGQGQTPPAAPTEDLVGGDEAGKGDYFGPLVAAAVRLPAARREAWTERGVADSKTLSDRRALELAEALEAEEDCEAVVIPPARYNEIYPSFRNLNDLLAWAHATAIARVLGRGPPAAVLVDRFAADEGLLASALRREGVQAARLEQRPRAEADVAVAAASVVARARFLRGLEELERRTGLRLAKGAGEPVEWAARRIVREHGPDRLREVAKLHFRTTVKVGGPVPPPR